MTIPIDFKTRMKLWRKNFQLFHIFKFAHHPLCDRFSDHVWKIGNIYVCQGCTLSILGAILGTFLLVIINPALTLIQWLILGISFLIPTLIVELFKIKYRPLKRTVRLIAGFDLGICLGLIISGSVHEKIFALIFIVFGYSLFSLIRRLKRPKDKCEGCFELKEEGICPGLKIEAALNREYSKYASDLLEKKISLQYINQNLVGNQYNQEKSEEN